MPASDRRSTGLAEVKLESRQIGGGRRLRRLDALSSGQIAGKKHGDQQRQEQENPDRHLPGYHAGA